MDSPRNCKITTYYEWLTKHGKTRHNCTEEKHVIDILRQWKAGYQMLDLYESVASCSHEGLQQMEQTLWAWITQGFRIKKREIFLWCGLSSTMNCEDIEVELLTHKRDGSRIPQLTFMRTTQTFFIIYLYNWYVMRVLVIRPGKVPNRAFSFVSFKQTDFSGVGRI